MRISRPSSGSVGVGIVSALLFVLCSPLAAHAVGARFVRIAADDAPRLEDLGFEERVIDYGSFLWLELGDGDLERLAASGVPFESADDAGQVRLPDFRFDPRVDGEPSLAEGLRAPSDGAGLRLVQLAGPAKEDWPRALEAAGLRLLQYYPHNSYLVWSEGERFVSPGDFVRWHGAFHPAYKISPELETRQGLLENVELLVYAGDTLGDPPADAAESAELAALTSAITALGGEVLNTYPAQPDRVLWSVVARLDAGAVPAAARLARVVWLGELSPQPTQHDEMSSQIVAGNHPDGVPVTGYLPWLGNLGFDGSGVVWSITDSGVDLGHADLDVVGGLTYPGCDLTGDSGGDDPLYGGHGTHVAGIFGGDGTGAHTDADGFLYGVGVAPGASIFAQSAVCIFQTSWPPIGGWQELSKQGLLGGAVGANNSWSSGIGISRGYQSTERTHDFMVRDGNFDTPGTAEPYVLVFSAGNSGLSPSTLTPPAAAKNLISVGASESYRTSSDLEKIATFSSRGPTRDGRRAPTVVAPGSNIASTRNDQGGFGCATAIPDTDDLYSFCSGTSMAAPHVSGALAVIFEWWRGGAESGGGDPSPAMAKALLVNSAVDVKGGTPPRPNPDEGWGRILLPAAIDPGTDRLFRDQIDVLDATGEVWETTVLVTDPGENLMVSLAWTDAPGAAGADPALVNDLDLRVEVGGNTYLGNQLSEGLSVPGGSPDRLDNLENVFVLTPGITTATITVVAANLGADGVPFTGDGTDQDFALVCSNCAALPDFTFAASPLDLELCAPAEGQIELDLTAELGFADPVTLGATGISGASVDFSTNPVTPTGSSRLTLSDTDLAATGHHVLEITASGGGRSHVREVPVRLVDALPGSPTLLSPSPGAVDIVLSPTFEWTAGTQATRTTLQIATDIGFTHIVAEAEVAGTSYLLLDSLAPDTAHFWRLRSENACGSATFTAASAFDTRAVPPILLVDDDDNLPDLRSFYTDLLDTLGLAYDVWDTDNSDLEPPAYHLEPYQVVLWFTGDAFDSTSGPGTPAEEALATYLEDTGGCLLLVSQETLFVRGLTSFFVEYMGLESFLIDASYSEVTGTGPGFGGLGPYTLSDNIPFLNFADGLSPTADAEPIFTADPTGAAIVRDGGAWRTLFLGFAIESITESSGHEELLGAMWDFCQERSLLFADGFESGDTSAWSAASSP